MNIFSCTGNLGKDCRVNQVSGSTVCNFNLAVKSGFGDKAVTIWIDCALWGKQAESKLPDYLLKGQQVAVSGELGQREHEGKNYLTLRVNSIDLIGKRDDNVQSQQNNQNNANAQQSKQQAQQQTAKPDFDFDDDIPF